jgi:hypothetical protein
MGCVESLAYCDIFSYLLKYLNVNTAFAATATNKLLCNFRNNNTNATIFRRTFHANLYFNLKSIYTDLHAFHLMNDYCSYVSEIIVYPTGKIIRGRKDHMFNSFGDSGDASSKDDNVSEEEEQVNFNVLFGSCPNLRCDQPMLTSNDKFTYHICNPVFSY